jgi:hypothetical protein
MRLEKNTRRLEKYKGFFVRSITPGRRYKGVQGGQKKYQEFLEARKRCWEFFQGQQRYR